MLLFRSFTFRRKLGERSNLLGLKDNLLVFGASEFGVAGAGGGGEQLGPELGYSLFKSAELKVNCELMDDAAGDEDDAAGSTVVAVLPLKEDMVDGVGDPGGR